MKDARTDAAANGIELLAVILVAGLIVSIGWTVAGDAPLARQAVVWIANVAMLATIWLGLRLRGQTWKHFGLSFRFAGRRVFVRTVALSLVVLVAALAAFVAGSALTMNLPAASEGADMGGYDYLRGNLPMLLLALAAVYVVSSFGEEVVYRGWLMTRVAEMGRETRAAWGVALVVSAAVFGLAHFDWGLAGIVQTACMGLALAAAYLLVRRNLWVLILAHACIDTLLLVQLYFGPSPPAAG